MSSAQRAAPTSIAWPTPRKRPASRTGYYVTNPATGDADPIWIADYVLMGYGTGAIMAVPGQDQRDWDFATEFELPIVRTVSSLKRASRARRTSATARR